MSRPPRPSEIADKIDKAADLLETQGWCTGKLRDDRDRHCLAGAVQACSVTKWKHDDCGWYVDGWSRPASETLIALDAAAKKDYQEASAVMWNDAQRDKRKVVRFMRRTARCLRNGDMHRTQSSEWSFR